VKKLYRADPWRAQNNPLCVILPHNSFAAAWSPGMLARMAADGVVFEEAS
jgi:hypothetical protein